MCYEADAFNGTFLPAFLLMACGVVAGGGGTCVHTQDICCQTCIQYLPKIPRLNSLLGYCVSTTLTLVPTSLAGPADQIGLLNRQYNFYDTNPSGAYCPTYAQFFGQMGVSLSMFLCGA